MPKGSPPASTGFHRQAWVDRGPLALWRTRHGMSLEEAAQALGVPLSTYHEWEHNGRLPASRARFEQVCQVLGEGSAEYWRSWSAWRSRVPA